MSVTINNKQQTTETDEIDVVPDGTVENDVLDVAKIDETGVTDKEDDLIVTDR